MRRIAFALCAAVIVTSAPTALWATDFTSSNFILRDPVVTIGGGFSSTTNFGQYLSEGQTVVGESTSTNFIYHSGFLYFPIITAPVLTSATAADSSVTLTWSAAVGSLGYTVSNYQIGASSASGGPYTYASYGNVLTATVLSLANGTTYYFVVRALNSLDDVLATSNELSATPFPSVVQNVSTGVPFAQTAGATFSGMAYSNAIVTVLKDGQTVGAAQANATGAFSFTLTGVTPGNYTFTLDATDPIGRLSRSVAVYLVLEAGKTAAVSGIFFSPTLEVDKEAVKPGDRLLASGQAQAGALVRLYLNDAFLAELSAEDTGAFTYNVSTARLAFGTYELTAESILGANRSLRSLPATFVVAQKTIPKRPPVCHRADLNCDGRIDLIDFSILIFWWQRPLPTVTIVRADLNSDTHVDLFDFSILVYYWTG